MHIYFFFFYFFFFFFFLPLARLLIIFAISHAAYAMLRDAFAATPLLPLP